MAHMSANELADWAIFLGLHIILLGAIFIYCLWSGWPWIPKIWVHRLWAFDAFWCAAWFFGPGSWWVLITVAIAIGGSIATYAMYRRKVNV